MTEILKVVACVKLSKEKPHKGVTLTNLGYGDFTPYFGLSRLIISILSLSGIVLTALIVGVLSEALQIPTEEKRVLVSMEHQRSDKIRQHAAAQLIQSCWKQFRFDVELQNKRMSIGNIHDHSFTDKLKFRYNSMFHKRNLTQKFADSLWRWRKIKAQTDQLRASMEKEFIQENTALETRFISQKLDELEKIVKIGPTSREDKLARHNTYSEVDFLLQRKASEKKTSTKRSSDRWMKAVQKAKSQKRDSSTENIQVNGVKRSSSAYLEDQTPKDQLKINDLRAGRRLSLANPLMPKIDIVVSELKNDHGGDTSKLHITQKRKSISEKCLMRRNSFQSHSTLNARRKSRASCHETSIHETVEEEKSEPSNSSSIHVFLDRLEERQQTFQNEMRSEISRLSEILANHGNCKTYDDESPN
ncbi:unnamed protein product [Oikopleura dioica]|uniref:Potassium channel domain-containing protein n=1 Tax=Oikopleura dioica TaxID=34765 RepID=E4YLW2_OIKDI|nr:unnamed protein product [Oikopleura dioica]